MLQVISGKFYGDAYKHNNDKTIRLYSNMKILESCKIGHFLINPVETENCNINAYDVSFNNQIEQQPGGFSLVDVGSDVVIYQLKNILTFFLDGFFDDDEYVAKKLCIPVGTKTRTKSVPSKFLRATFDMDKIAEPIAISKVDDFLCNMIGLKRDEYEAIITCISAYCAAIRLLVDEPNLAYCMLVITLESLSQKFDKYEPVWEDYNETLKNNIDKALKNIDGDNANAIRTILITDSHLKLTQRFLHFVLDNVKDDFYFDETVSNKILKDDIIQALKNAYNIRSKYAHTLKIIIDQAMEDDTSKKSDYFKYFQEPYFTFSGLLRLTRHVIINFVLHRTKVEKESIDWTNCVPGMRIFQVGPEFWLSKMESDNCLKAKKRFEGFVAGLCQNVIYDIENVINLYIKHFPTLKEEYKKPIFSLCVLWNESYKYKFNEEKDAFKKFIDKNKKRFNDCCIENAVMYALFSADSDINKWDYNAYEKILQDYISKKHKYKNYMFPCIIETIMYLNAAHYFIHDEKRASYWTNQARFNCANDIEVLLIMDEVLSHDEKIEKIWNTVTGRYTQQST